MKIIVLAGGLSPERQVSLVSGQNICRALRGLGHQAALVDMFLGLEDWTGPLEAIFSALALRDGFIPATINYQTPDPDCDLDVVPNQGRNAEIRYVLSNSLGFGGHNGSLLFKKWEA